MEQPSGSSASLVEVFFRLRTVNHVPVQIAGSLLKQPSPIYFDYLQGDHKCC
jgi:hypothetical protein